MRASLPISLKCTYNLILILIFICIIPFIRHTNHCKCLEGSDKVENSCQRREKFIYEVGDTTMTPEVL